MNRGDPWHGTRAPGATGETHRVRPLGRAVLAVRILLLLLAAGRRRGRLRRCGPRRRAAAGSVGSTRDGTSVRCTPEVTAASPGACPICQDGSSSPSTVFGRHDPSPDAIPHLGVPAQYDFRPSARLRTRTCALSPGSTRKGAIIALLYRRRNRGGRSAGSGLVPSSVGVAPRPSRSLCAAKRRRPSRGTDRRRAPSASRFCPRERGRRGPRGHRAWTVGSG